MTAGVLKHGEQAGGAHHQRVAAAGVYRRGRGCSGRCAGCGGQRGRIHKLHAVAGLQQRGELARQVPHRRFGYANKLPAAGAGLRIDRTECACQRDGTCWHLGARRAAARHVEDRVATT
ncbi:hypothetical protein SDC9_149806 [bioreactor metagenome]|uniref:Uncharacterized protein n=1 Tax=bioreactor metagenome TaxID=1076179 RepID=A0A645EMJ7_9ZZZZ